MSKGTLVISVQAETKKATQQIKNLQKDVSGSKGLGDLGKSLKGIGLDGIGGGLGKLGDLAGNFAKFAGPGGALAATALGIKKVKDGIDELVQSGKTAQRDYETMNTQLTTLARNFGQIGTQIPDVTKELQLMSANGVNSFESISGAMQTLTVAFEGNVIKAKDLVKSFDDLAAGTGIQIDDWASMASEVMLTGVSIKDLTKLSNKGIPIYQAFGKVLGTTADEAEKLAKAGQINTDQWLAAVNELAKSYKGLSAAMSSQTLEGAQATFEASKSLATQGAAEGYSEERIAGLNELSDQLQKFAKHDNWQATIKALGMVSAEGENVADKFKLMMGVFQTRAATKFFDAISGGGFSEIAEQQRQLKYNQTIADLSKGYAQAMSGELSAEQIRNLIDTIAETRFELDKEGNTGWEERLKQLETLLDKQVQIEQQQVQKQTSSEAIMKYGTLEQKLAQVSGKEGVPILLDPAEIEGAVEKIKQGLMEGTYSDPQLMMQALETLIPLLNEYQAAQKAATDATKNATKSTKEGGLFGDIKKIGENIIKNAAKELEAAQAELATVEEKIQEQRMAAQEIADEEAHGIFREKWGDLDVSKVKSVDTELLKKQDDLNKKIKELTELDKKNKNNLQQQVLANSQAVKTFADNLGNRIISIKAVVDPIRVG